ncbi:MAG: branched-chain amino acid ABC transporter permease [Rhodoferax sp.]|nr:branched-chain amino acid ABC transporter permease [Rhodoferax sp.]
MNKRAPAGSSWQPWLGYSLVLLAAPLIFTSSLSHTLLCQIGIAIIICLSYNILLGQGGMLSFGHAIYPGIGSFLAIHALHLVARGAPLPVSLIPLAGGFAGLLLALPLAWVATRRSGTTFAMISLGVGELVWATALLLPQFFGGEGGVSGNRAVGARPIGISFGPQLALYYLIAVYTLVCTALMFAFTRTPLGRMLNAVRDNPQRAGFVGYDPRQVRYRAFLIAAFFAGIAGGLSALNFEIVTTEVFSAYRSAAYLLFTFLGGTGFFAGPIIGAILMVLAFVVLSGLTRAWLLYVGLGFVLMVMLAPGGIAGLIMANLRVVRGRRCGPLIGLYGGLLLTSLLALAGAAAMVEMVYHRQLDAALGSQLQFLGWALDTASARSWWTAAAVMATGVGLFEPLRRLFAERWDVIQLAIQNDAPGAGSGR